MSRQNVSHETYIKNPLQIADCAICGGFALPGAIRTRGLSLRRRTLYPAELRRDDYSGYRVGKSAGFRKSIALLKERNRMQEAGLRLPRRHTDYYDILAAACQAPGEKFCGLQFCPFSGKHSVWC